MYKNSIKWRTKCTRGNKKTLSMLPIVPKILVEMRRWSHFLEKYQRCRCGNTWTYFHHILNCKHAVQCDVLFDNITESRLLGLVESAKEHAWVKMSWLLCRTEQYACIQRLTIWLCKERGWQHYAVQGNTTNWLRKWPQSCINMSDTVTKIIYCMKNVFTAELHSCCIGLHYTGVFLLFPPLQVPSDKKYCWLRLLTKWVKN